MPSRTVPLAKDRSEPTTPAVPSAAELRVERHREVEERYRAAQEKYKAQRPSRSQLP